MFVMNDQGLCERGCGVAAGVRLVTMNVGVLQAHSASDMLVSGHSSNHSLRTFTPVQS